MAEITQLRRRHESWAPVATQALAAGRVDEARQGYETHDALHRVAAQEDAQRELLLAWQRTGAESPESSRLMLAYTRDEVQGLKVAARAVLQHFGRPAGAVKISTTRVVRKMAIGGCVIFLRNERRHR